MHYYEHLKGKSNLIFTHQDIIVYKSDISEHIDSFPPRKETPGWWNLLQNKKPTADAVRNAFIYSPFPTDPFRTLFHVLYARASHLSEPERIKKVEDLNIEKLLFEHINHDFEFQKRCLWVNTAKSHYLPDVRFQDQILIACSASNPRYLPTLTKQTRKQSKRPQIVNELPSNLEKTLTTKYPHITEDTIQELKENGFVLVEEYPQTRTESETIMDKTLYALLNNIPIVDGYFGFPVRLHETRFIDIVSHIIDFRTKEFYIIAENDQHYSKKKIEEII